MCNKLELVYSSFFSTLGSILYLASTKNPMLWQLSESAWYKAAHYHKSPSHRDFPRTTLQTPALLRLNIFPETKHYFLLRNSCLLYLNPFCCLLRAQERPATLILTLTSGLCIARACFFSLELEAGTTECRATSDHLFYMCQNLLKNEA